MNIKMIHLNTKTKGFTLVELIVAMLIAGICIVAAGSFLISGTNLLGNAQRNATEERVSDDLADFIKERLLFAESIEVVQENQIRTADLAKGSALLYIGDGANPTNVENKGYLFFKQETETAPTDVFGSEYYQKNKASLDYKATVESGKTKIFEITVTVYDGDDSKGYNNKKTFKLVNSTANFSPITSVTKEGLNTKYYLLIQYPTNVSTSVEADGDITDPDAEKSRAQEWKVPKTGRYKIEVWGANGGDGQLSTVHGLYKGGTGGYASGTVKLTKGTIIYLKAGGRGRDKGYDDDGNVTDSFNGGGLSQGTHSSKGEGYSDGPWYFRSGEGGGASDVRISINSLYARVIVAGGGGGAGVYNWPSNSAYIGNGGNGGGTIGGTGGNNANAPGGGGTQSAGGSNGSGYTTASGFGVGGSSVNLSAGNTGGAGGGGGWYGGGASARGGSVHTGGAGGGSGFVLTSGSVSNTPGGYLLGSEYYMTDTVNVLPTDSSFVTKPSTGKSGYVRITFLGR
jgi:prepilin-type N-terminal cleavage/methylation domain-containing protein